MPSNILIVVVIEGLKSFPIYLLIKLQLYKIFATILANILDKLIMFFL